LRASALMQTNQDRTETGTETIAANGQLDARDWAAMGRAGN
jgi:hypothetical protein